MANIGDYVIATRWSDGSPNDPFCVGFLVEIANNNPPKYIVEYGTDILPKSGKFRKVQRISPKTGQLIVNNIHTIENSGKSVWWWVKHFNKHEKI